jgi:hypothetical protein
LNEIKRKRQEAQDLLQEAELEQAMAEEDAAIVSAIATAMEEACIVDLQRALQWAYDVGLGGELVEFAEGTHTMIRDHSRLHSSEMA